MTDDTSKKRQPISDSHDSSAESDVTGQSQNGRSETGVKEIGGRSGLDPTRYGDWEKNGRCIDF